MTNKDIQAYLYEQIPLTRAMAIAVTEASETEVRLSAPLAPNINHQESAFGGSISAAAMLSCWTLMHIRLRQIETPTQLVIHKNNIIYREPVLDKFEAVCRFPKEEAWQDVLTMLERCGKAKIILNADIWCRARKVAVFQGSFVTLKA